VGAPAAGDVVLLPFPFSDLSGAKLRPALILASANRGDWIACQITSNPYGDPLAIRLDADAFSAGSLQRASFARPGKLFTANDGLISASCGALTEQTLRRVRDAVVAILCGTTPAENSND
jgi:mRNA interferase MazF